MDSCVYYTPWTVKCFAYVCIVTNNALNRGLMGILESYVTLTGKTCLLHSTCFVLKVVANLGSPVFREANRFSNLY